MTNKFPAPFRSSFGYSIFLQKYRHEGCETWEALARTLVIDVCGGLLPKSDMDQLTQYIAEMKFIPGGRYLYYAGRPRKFFNNCYLLRAEEDTREDWANLAWKATSCLMTGGGIGVDYSVYRGSGSNLSATGGVASGPLSAMHMINEIGRNVMQGGSRRSAIYASLSKDHPDIDSFMTAKNWSKALKAAKADNFNAHAPLDMTNISVNYGTSWIEAADRELDPVFIANVRQALSSGDPGFSFNFYDQENETLRNACTEVTSADDSDVCNLGSVNLGRIDSLEEFGDVCALGTQFLLCGTLRAELPYEKVYETRRNNRRLGLGLMGLHEWLLKRGKPYDTDDELMDWLETYQDTSSGIAIERADRLSISEPIATRAVAPTGTIGILSGTTTGIEPIYAVAYRRRYLKDGTQWHYQYVVDSTAEELIERYELAPHDIETALDLSQTSEGVERRIAMQALVQDYVDQGISSTINLPAWGTGTNNEDRVREFAGLISQYAPRLRGLTLYPDGARGGQPLTSVPYWFAKGRLGEEVAETQTHDVCSITGKGGSCGV